MRRSRNLRRASWIIALVVGQGCGDGVSLEWELPFDPTGTWEAHVQGLRSGSGIDDLMVLTLSLDGEPWIPPGADFAVVEFTGTWEWGGLTGVLTGFWNAGATTDDAARNSGGQCPEFFGVCSLTLSLAPPPDACALRGGEGYQIFMSLLGWFDGPRALVGARLGGTYWEGQFDDPQPCPGPEMISLDTDVVLTRG